MKTKKIKIPIQPKNPDEFLALLTEAAVKGGYTLPITALSRETSIILTHLKKGKAQQQPTAGRPVLIFTCAS